MRYVVFGYTTKSGPKEFTSAIGYDLHDGEPIPSHSKVREKALCFANKYGYQFEYFQINFIKFLNESDFKSFMEIN
ncbi:hypothetical protein NVP1132O_65 [Vibrio phage 1.132.O._10N.222.49.F8]|nr:hypothetical protein NVP1132O_65 [Vibrio phage 1.132.O._10N.222.49.F8]